LPDEVSYNDAVCTLGDGIKAFTALHYLANAGLGDTIMLLDALSPCGCLLLQLAMELGITKVRFIDKE
jgi:NADPH:quinone reductase-like Zn-dependent oxidoreductase